MVTPFLIAGCGRSGTKWAAELLTALGYPCGHEEQFSYDREGPLTASESSWLAVPHLDSVPPSTRILRVMRDPFKVVQSAMAKGFLLDMADPYAVFVALHRPDIALGRNHLARVIRYVALWDEPLDSRNILRVDGNTHTITGAVRYATADPVSRGDVGSARKAVSTSTNTTDPALRLPAPTVDQIEDDRDGDLITARAERFGYERS